MKTRLFLLASISILAALFISGAVFAEGEVPQDPAAEVPPAAPEEMPAAVEEPTISESAPPPAEGEVPPAPPEEAPIAAEEPIILDGATPPAEGAPAPEEVTDTTPVQPAEDAIPAESAAVETEAQPEVTPIEPVIGEATLPAAEAPAAAEPPLAVVTAEPQIVLADPAGEPLDLASQESAEAIASADPYFKVGLITYRFSEVAGYCDAFDDDTHCFDPGSTDPVNDAIQYAIDYIRNNPGTNPTNGLIYVEKATYTDDVEIYADTYPVLSTLKGLIGEPDADGVFPSISGNVTIRGTTLGFTLSGFNIFGAVNFDGNTGTLNLTDLDVSKDTAEVTGGGIHIIGQTGNVVMTNVRSSHNLNTGVDINNTLGGNVTISNSAFDDNGTAASTHGLRVDTNGVVTINGFSASHNYDTQVIISGFSSLTLKNAVLSGSGLIGDGLFASSVKAAPVIIQNVTAKSNANYGLHILTLGNISLTAVDAFSNDTGLLLDNLTGVGTVSLNSVRANNNNLDGINITSKGSVTLTSVKADNNSNYGAILNNSTGTASVTVTSPTTSGFAGANSFSGNSAYAGLWINSSGAVTVTNIEASANAGYGLYITNGTGTVTINKNLANWTNDFSGNGPSGLYISTQGIVSLSSSSASSNLQEGISITGKGAITLTDVQAFNNGLSIARNGLSIDNSTGSGSVTIRSTVVSNFMDFSGNTLYGIHIKSKGAVSVSSVRANNNNIGLYIENFYNETASPGVTVSNGEFNDNQFRGVVVMSKGAITLTNVSACRSLNSQPGVDLDNSTYGTSSGVTINSSSSSVFYEFSRNTGSGIQIYSKGAVAVSNVIAESNGSDGIYINNYGGSDKPVSISNSLFNGNTQDGIEIISKGTVTLTNTGASENANGYGATISNQDGVANTGVTIRSTLTTKYYDFSGNGWDGIYIRSEGGVSIGNVLACENENYGLNINRTMGTGAISITRGTFDHNPSGGVEVLTTPGAITLTDVTASHNGILGLTTSSGVHINAAYSSTFGGSVTIKSSLAANFYDFSNNTKHGIEIFAKGLISVSNVTAEGNTHTNIFLDNTYADPLAPKPVSVARSTANSSIDGSGFEIRSLGNVTLNDLTANDNISGAGLYVDAGDGVCLIPASVTLSGARNEFSGNDANGIFIATEGNISLANVIADNTISGEGINLYNSGYTDAIGNVTITASTNFWNSTSANYREGLLINTNGTVSISRLRSNENLGDYGLMISNYYQLVKNVTLTSVETNRNRGSYGLYIHSLGAVALNSTRADSNEQFGLRIDTLGAVTLNGVSASYNSKHEADIPYASTTIYERLTSDAAGDIWHFVGDNSLSYTITLESADFDAYLQLFKWNTGTEEWDFYISDDSSYVAGSGIDDAQLTFPSGAGGLTTGDLYYILATTNYGWGAAGGAYTFGFNGPGTTYPLDQYIGAEIDNHFGTGNVSITSPATFWSSFNENNYAGLIIKTNSTVNITNSDAANNNNNGIHISGTPGPNNVTIRNTLTTRIMSISGNGYYGIHVPSAYGAITISGRIQVNDNGYTGVYLINSNVDNLTPKAVTLTLLTASNNQNAGIIVNSKGAITLTSITASGNQSTGNGVGLYNAYPGILSNITISGSNIFSNNMGHGLHASTNGTLSIMGVRTENNAEYGLYLESNTSGRSVTLSNIIAQYNGNTGVYLKSAGTVTLSNVRSCVNDGDGIRITIMSGDYHTYINNSTVIGNAGYGIYVNKPKSSLHLLGTLYLGNNTDNVVGVLDLYYSP